MSIIARTIPGIYRENHSTERIISEIIFFCQINGNRTRIKKKAAIIEKYIADTVDK